MCNNSDNNIIIKYVIKGDLKMEKKVVRRSLPGKKSVDIRALLPLICLAVLGVYTIVAVLVSHFALLIPVVATCAIAILEALLAAFLNRIPLWIHGLVFIAQIVAGIIASNVVFMILMALVYALSTIFLFIWSRNE